MASQTRTVKPEPRQLGLRPRGRYRCLVQQPEGDALRAESVPASPETLETAGLRRGDNAYLDHAPATAPAAVETDGPSRRKSWARL